MNFTLYATFLAIFKCTFDCSGAVTNYDIVPCHIDEAPANCTVNYEDHFSIVTDDIPDCVIDGKPVLWDGYDAKITCSANIVNQNILFRMIQIVSANVSETVFDRTPVPVTVDGTSFRNNFFDYGGNHNPVVLANNTVSFIVAEFNSSRHSSRFTCIFSNAGIFLADRQLEVDLTGRIFPEPAISSIQLTAEVNGQKVENGDNYIALPGVEFVTVQYTTTMVNENKALIPVIKINDVTKPSVFCSQTDSNSTSRFCQMTVKLSKEMTEVVGYAVLCNVNKSLTVTIATTPSTSIGVWLPAVLTVLIILAALYLLVLLLYMRKEGFLKQICNRNVKPDRNKMQPDGMNVEPDGSVQSQMEAT